jgi:hypothetical protein
VISGLVAAASPMSGRDFAAEGRSLERLGREGMNAKEIQNAVESG